MHIQNMHSLHHTGKMKNVKHIVALDHQVLGNLFKFKAETIFNRMNIQHILRIKNYFQRRSWAN